MRPSALDDFPQLIVSPVMFAVIWSLVFEPHQQLDTDRFMDAHVELLLAAIENRAVTGGAA